MKLTELTENVAIHQTLPDEPNADGGLTAAELKAKFDEAARILKNYLNTQVVPAVNSKQDAATIEAAIRSTEEAVRAAQDAAASAAEAVQVAQDSAAAAEEAAAETELLLTAMLPYSIWQEIDWDDIRPEDTFAITATVDNNTYVLPVVPSVKAAASEAIPELTGTVEENILKVNRNHNGTKYSFGWKRYATTGGYHIKSADGAYYLYVSNSNNGIRIHNDSPNKTFIWNILRCGHLGASDGVNYRTLGVFGHWIVGVTSDKTASGDVNITLADNTVRFWKLCTVNADNILEVLPAAEGVRY